MKRRFVILLMVLVLAAGLAGGWLLGRAPTVPRESVTGAVSLPAAPPAADEQPTAGTGPTAAGVPAKLGSASLDTLPVVDLAAHLEPLARRGDPQAACRLGAALLECVRFNGRERRYVFATPQSISAAPETEQAHLINVTARLEAREELTAAACRGVTRDQHYLAGLRFLLAAANRGAVAARLDFVMHSPTVTDLLQFPEAGRLYMDNAPRLFSDMWREGDPAAIEVLHTFGAAVGGPEQRSAPWLAIPPELRGRQLARDLWALRVRATSENQQFRSPPPSPYEPPADPAITAQAHAYWDELFAHSPHVAAEREARMRKMAAWEANPMRRRLIRNPCAE
jgi:hypothetical protein